MSEENETVLFDIEECPECGYQGVYSEVIENDLTLMICPSCKNSYVVNTDIEEN